MSVTFLGFLIQWYVVSSWWAWDQGKSFGGRMFIVCTPIFALGLALLLTRLRDTGRLRVGLAAACLLVAPVTSSMHHTSVKTTDAQASENCLPSR